MSPPAEKTIAGVKRKRKEGLEQQKSSSPERQGGDRPSPPKIIKTSSEEYESKGSVRQQRVTLNPEEGQRSRTIVKKIVKVKVTVMCMIL